MDYPSHAARDGVRRASLCHALNILLVLAGLLTSVLAASRAQAAEQSTAFVGRSVAEVLDHLRPQGLTFIYNTRIVPADLRIDSEPEARSGLALATEILGAHGLTVSRVTAGVFAVIVQPEGQIRPVEAVAPGIVEPTLEEVTVHASRYMLQREFGASEQLLTQEDVQNMPRLGEETLRAVQHLPGVASNGISSLGSIRGGEPGETAIVLDGLRLYEPFHLKNFLSPISLLDSRLIASMQVYSGGFPVIHGERMSSIIDATSLDPSQPRYYEAGLSLFHANVLASSQFAQGRGQGVISARRSNIGDLARYSEKDFGEPQYFDGFAKADYRFSDTTRAKLELLASNDRILAIRDSGMERASAQYRNAYVWGTLEHEGSRGEHSRLILSYTDVNNARHGRVDDPGRRSGEISDRRNFHVVGLRADHEFAAADIDQRIGVEVRRLWGSYRYDGDVHFEAGFPFPDSPASSSQRSARPKPDGFESAAWWDGRVALGRRWTVQAGVRFDTQTYDGSGDAEQIAPRMNVLYDLSEATRLRASWGRFFQAQGINELQVEDGIERFHKAQHADHYILSLERALAHGLDMRIEAYRKDYGRTRARFENLFNPLVLLPEIEFDRVMIAADSARAEGVELLLRVQSQGAWRGWVGYAWSRAEDRIAGQEVKRSWDQSHAINLGIGWASGPWAVTVTDSFHTGWPTTRLTLAMTPTGVQPVVGERNSRRLGAYNSLDLRVTKTLALARGALDIFLEISNALARDNPCCTDYTLTRLADGTVTLEDEVETWLPLVPSIGVLWRY